MKFIRLILLLPVGLLLLARASDNSDTAVFTPIDPATEVRLAIVFRDQNLKHLFANGWKLATNQEYIEVVNQVGNRIAATIAERPDLSDEWEFTVLQPTNPRYAADPRWVNAFAFGGGKVVVQSPILEVIRINGKIDEDMLASILGHEMTHCVRSHLMQDFSISGSLNWLLTHLDDITSNDGSRTLTKEAKAKLAAAASAQFTRNQEAEADALGALFATRAGYDGFGGAVRWMKWADLNLPTFAFEYLPAGQPESAAQPQALDHPTWKDRLANLLRYKDQIAVLVGEFNWGCFALENFDFDRAAVCFGDVVKVFPNSYEAQNNLGLAYHWLYLREAGIKEKFQPGLVNCFVSFRERLRGESTLSKAMAHYRKALELDPYATEPRTNLAMALIETHDQDKLAEAEDVLQKLLAKYPSDPRLLNDMAILLYWKASSGGNREADLAKVAELFRKAWDQKASELKVRLPALYNLGVLEIEAGQKAQGVSHLVEYLKSQPFGPWAELAQSLVKQNNGEVPSLVAESTVPIKDILNVAPGMTEAEVIKILGQPDQTQNVATSEEDEGQILSYEAMGINVVLVEGKVASVNVFTPGGGNPILRTAGAAIGPTVAGIRLGEPEDALPKALGEPNEVKEIPGTAHKILFYLREKTIFKVTIEWGKVVKISLMSRKQV